MSAPEPPSLSLLREQAASLPAPHEYTVAQWLSAAQDLIASCTAKYRASPKDPRVQRDAFVGLKQAAEIWSKRVPNHPSWAAVKEARGADYTVYRETGAMLVASAGLNTEIGEALRGTREAWEEAHRLSLPPAIVTNGSSARSTPSPLSASPSAAPASIADRFARLRSAGMTDAPTISKPQPPLIPKKPGALRASPTTSPRAQSSFPNGPATGEDRSSSLASTSKLTEETDFDRVGSLPSPSGYESFPSISGFEEQFSTRPRARSTEGQVESGYHFPSVPMSDPAGTRRQNGNGWMPPPPLAFPLNGEEEARTSRTEIPPSLLPARPRPPIPLPLLRPPAISVNPPLPTPPTPARIPFTSDVAPLALYNFLQTPDGMSLRVLFLDVRTLEAYGRGRIRGNVVCIEPVTVRQSVDSTALEESLILSPPAHRALFSSRSTYDLLIIYDTSSLSIPSAPPPPSTSSDAQRVLWGLMRAIYENEFTKSLKRMPVLLRGGWNGWEREVGERGIERDEHAVEGVDEFGRLEARKAINRKTSIMPSTQMGQPVLRAAPDDSNYFSSSTTHFGAQGYGHAQTSSIQSPRLAIPPSAVQRTSSGYDGMGAIGGGVGMLGGRPAYVQPTLPYGGLDRRTSDFGEGAMQSQSFGDHGGYASPTSNGGYASPSGSRTPIEYPRLSPVVARTAPVAPPPLTRPPAAQPAPIRSNSSSMTPYSSSSSAALVQASRFAGGSAWGGIGGGVGEDSIGLTGLKNLGNTCYMNSTLQCLSATIPFARYFKDGSFKKDINYVNKMGTSGALALAVSDLIRSMWSESYNFLAPISFREQICRFAPQFRGSDQHDAQEFLGFLLDGLHEDLNYVLHKPKGMEMTRERERDLETRPQQEMSKREWDLYLLRDNSFVVQGFQGQFRNVLRCLTCGKTSTTYNTFMPLSIPVPAGRGITKATLDECLTAFVKEEILDKDDSWFCPQCKTHRKASKKLTISRLPPILIIHLKRFSFKGPFSDKVETQVQYPLAGLDLTSYIPPPLFDKRAPPMTSPPKGSVYDLYAVTNHYGNLSSGHYTAFIRNHRDWFSVGDSKYAKVDPASVQSARSAYILYYRLR